MWILTKKYLPLMTTRFRSSLETFHRELFKIGYNEEAWYFCTVVVKNWMSFGLEALRENPDLVAVSLVELDQYKLDRNLN